MVTTLGAGMTQPLCDRSNPDDSVACKSVSVPTSLIGTFELTWTVTDGVSGSVTSGNIAYSVINAFVPTFIPLVEEDLKLDPSLHEVDIKIDLHSNKTSYSYFSPKASSAYAGKVQISLKG